MGMVEGKKARCSQCRKLKPFMPGRRYIVGGRELSGEDLRIYRAAQLGKIKLGLAEHVCASCAVGGA